ncbi:MAG: hypothetical protein ACK4Y5_08390 [Acetobacteraceae bacterium]|jgi:hypothetical protein
MTSPYTLAEGWSGWPQAARDAAYDNLNGVADSAQGNRLRLVGIPDCGVM